MIKREDRREESRNRANRVKCRLSIETDNTITINHEVGTGGSRRSGRSENRAEDGSKGGWQFSSVVVLVVIHRGLLEYAACSDRVRSPFACPRVIGRVSMLELMRSWDVLAGR